VLRNRQRQRLALQSLDSPQVDRYSGQLPSIFRRIACMLYESLLLLGVLSITFMVPHLILGMAFSMSLPGWLLLTHVFIVLGAYFIWYWSHGGQTLAMQTWKIHLTTPSGNPPTMPRLLLRYFLAWPSLVYFGVGLLWSIFDRDRQFLHDRLAGTRLVFK
jgi:uncharacterized RDD family membrane protein YckC